VRSCRSMQVYEMFHIQSKYKCIMVMWSASGSPPKKYLAVLDIACLGGWAGLNACQDGLGHLLREYLIIQVPMDI